MSRLRHIRPRDGNDSLEDSIRASSRRKKSSGKFRYRRFDINAIVNDRLSVMRGIIEENSRWNIARIRGDWRFFAARLTAREESL